MYTSLQPRLSLITLGVEDIARSRHFYEHGLGWKVHEALSQDDVVFFQLQNIILSLYPRVSLAADANVAAGEPGFSGITLAYNTHTREEVKAVLQLAKVAGATILKPAEDAFWGGYSGYFADPDGHPWEVAWNPGFPIRPDGTVILPVSD